MAGSAPAALFFSHITLVLIWITWIALFRRLRADFLRARLRPLQYELERIALPNAAEQSSLVARDQLSQWILQAIVSAEHLTVTRLVLSCIWASLAPPVAEHTDVRISAIKERLIKLIADHASGGLPLLSPLLQKRSGGVGLMLESCAASRPVPIVR